MGTEEFDDTDFEDIDMDNNESPDGGDTLSSSTLASPPDTRRRLEERLEEERLKRQLSEYDFDFDDWCCCKEGGYFHKYSSFPRRRESI